MYITAFIRFELKSNRPEWLLPLTDRSATATSAVGTNQNCDFGSHTRYSHKTPYRYAHLRFAHITPPYRNRIAIMHLDFYTVAHVRWEFVEYTLQILGIWPPVSVYLYVTNALEFISRSFHDWILYGNSAIKSSLLGNQLAIHAILEVYLKYGVWTIHILICYQ